MSLAGAETTPSDGKTILTRGHLVRSSLWLAALLVASRLLGAALQIAVAALFGTSSELDAYLVASSIPQLMTGLYASGATILLVPLLARSDAPDPDPHARPALDSALSYLVLAVLVTAVAGAVLARPITAVLGPGFTGSTLALTANLFRWFMVFLAMSALGSIVMGILNGRGSFIAPGLASVGQSLVWLALLLLLVRPLGVYALLLGGIGGALVFLLAQLPNHALRSPHGFRPSFRAGRNVLVGFAAPMAVFGAVFAFGQINVVADRFFASMLPSGAVSILDYAAKIHIVLLNVIAYSAVTPAYTRMSRDLAQGDAVAFRETVTFTTRMLVLAATPTVLVTTVLREPIIRVLLQHGQFTSADTAQASSALALMAPAQLATAFTLLLIYTLFALRDTRVLLGLSTLSMLANLILDWLLFRRFGVEGIAAASSLAFVPVLVIMAVLVGRRVVGFDWRRLGALLSKVAASACAATITAYAVFATAVGPSPQATLAAVILGLAAALIGAILVYLGMLTIFRVEEAIHIRRAITAILTRRSGK